MRLAFFLFALLCSTLPAHAAKTILVMGDSLSAGYGIRPEQAWPALLGQRLSDKRLDYSVANLSISGETTAGGRSRLDAALKNHKPAIVVIALGANDGLRGLALAQMRDNLNAMIDMARSSGARVALAGMRLHELDLASGPRTLSRLEGDGLAPDDFVVYSMPSSYFSRDPIASIGTGVALHRMYYNQRNREVPFYKTFLTYHPDFAGTPFWYDNHSAAHIEGGDVLNINETTLAVGISEEEKPLRLHFALGPEL